LASARPPSFSPTFSPLRRLHFQRASPAHMADSASERWREELSEGSRVWVLKASIKLWYEGSVVKRFPQDVKVQFMDGGVPCFKTVPLSSPELQLRATLNSLRPRPTPNPEAFESGGAPAPPAPAPVKAEAAVPSVDSIDTPVVPRWRAGGSPRRGEEAPVERGRVRMASLRSRSPASSRDDDDEESNMGVMLSKGSEDEDAAPMRPLNSGSYTGVAPSMHRTYSEMSSLTHTSMPDLTPFAFGTQEELPHVDECCESNFAGLRGLGAQTVDCLPAMYSDASRGRGALLGSRLKVRSASAGKSVDAVCIDSNDQTMKVFFSVGHRNYVESVPAPEAQIQRGSFAPGTQVKVRSASVGRPVEGVVTAATGDKVRVQYFLNGRCHIKTVSRDEAELNLESAVCS